MTLLCLLKTPKHLLLKDLPVQLLLLLVDPGELRLHFSLDIDTSHNFALKTRALQFPGTRTQLLQEFLGSLDAFLPVFLMLQASSLAFLLRQALGLQLLGLQLLQFPGALLLPRDAEISTSKFPEEFLASDSKFLIRLFAKLLLMQLLLFGGLSGMGTDALESLIWDDHWWFFPQNRFTSLLWKPAVLHGLIITNWLNYLVGYYSVDELLGFHGSSYCLVVKLRALW